MLKHWPLIKVLSAALGSYSIILLVHILFLKNVGVSIFWIATAFLAGISYTHFFEWWYHWGPMHKGFRIGGHKLMEGVLKSHLVHHRIFHGENFTSHNPENLEQVISKWHVFPTLLFVHYFLSSLFLAPEIRLAFFTGVASHYCWFEIGHWFTHVDNTLFDKISRHIPIWNKIRARQIEHHRLHHEEVLWNFNFTPPYLGDHLGKTFKKS
jgi:hypothetical protein